MRFLCTLFVLVISTSLMAVNVTFRVDMSQVVVSPNGIYIAGSFQGWNPSATAMTPVGNSVYETTVSLAAGEVQFKYVNGNAWGTDEFVPSGCGVPNGSGGYNRSYTVIDGADVVLDVVCFGNCIACQNLMLIPVTFKVDMSQQVVSPNGVHVAGSFQTWNPSTSVMTDANSDGIYEFTTNIQNGLGIQYKFINGNDWSGQEAVPQSCGQGDGFGGFNRYTALGSDPLVMLPVCFGECYPCTVAPVEVNVTFQVDMTNETVDPNGVHLVGAFQNWNSTATLMTDMGNGLWQFDTTLFSGNQYLFKYINGNDFAGVEIVPAACGADDGFGAYNRNFYLDASDTVLEPVCFSSCSTCVPIVDPIMVNVSFQVDMSNEMVDPAGIHIAGSFQAWDAAATAMTDMGNGIWEYSTQLESNTSIEFRFINGTTFGTSETVPAGCGVSDGFGNFNRTLDIAMVDAAFGPVCFGSCEACLPIVDPVFVDITFKVNMTNQTVSPDGVHIAGIFQNWDASSDIMTDAGNGIWEYTTSLEAGTDIEFKYVNGNAWGLDESVPSACAQNGNRYFTVPDISSVLDTVCFAECNNCGEVVEPVMVMVLFQVDMSNEVVSPNGVHIAGNFQGWNPNGTVMNDLGAGIFELLYEVEANTTIDFKFINGSNWTDSEIVPAECGADDGNGSFNRSFDVGSTNDVFGPVCFSQCSDCSLVVEPTTVSVTFQVDMSNEVVSPDGVHVAGSFQGWNPASTALTDIGNGIWQYTAQIDTSTTILFKFINGIDWPQSETVPADCGASDGFGGYNRTFDVGTINATYGPVCFASCIACQPLVPVLITLRVDMINETIDPTGVYVAGDFNAWDATATQMSEYSPGKYQAVIILNSGETTGYKFLNGSDFAGEEIVPSACGVSNGFGGYNRSYTATGANETLAVVCFSSCVECSVIPMSNVTFKVDMSQVAVDANGVHIAGSFNNFDPTASLMSLSSPGVYSFTAAVAQNTSLTYKFINGNTFAGVESVPFECGVDDGFGAYNRSINVTATDLVLNEVCFSLCVDCPTSVGDNSTTPIVLYPNPAQSILTIQLGERVVSSIQVYDGYGRLISTQGVNGRQMLQMNVSEWADGIYSITSAEGVSLGRFSVVH